MASFGEEVECNAFAVHLVDRVQAGEGELRLPKGPVALRFVDGMIDTTLTCEG